MRKCTSAWVVSLAMLAYGCDKPLESPTTASKPTEVASANPPAPQEAASVRPGTAPEAEARRPREDNDMAMPKMDDPLWRDTISESFGAGAVAGPRKAKGGARGADAGARERSVR